MRFGLQKLTLLDYPGLTACTVFTCGCNFRCPFCHNGSIAVGGESEMPLDTTDLLRFLEERKKILDGVCITGGEPLLHSELPDVIGRIKKLGYKVKLDTNGSRPEILSGLLSSGNIDYVAMDIKQCQEKYAEASGVQDMLPRVLESVTLLKNSAVDFEFRTTVVSPIHTPDDIEKIARWISGCRHYYLQNFVDSGDILDKDADLGPIAPEVLEQMLERAKMFIPAAMIRGK